MIKLCNYIYRYVSSNYTTMIKITNIEIGNYRSCINTKFKIKENLTAIIGANGAGKSNILNSILLLSGRMRGSRTYGRNRKLDDSTSHSTLTFDLEIDESKFKLKADIHFETDERNSDEIYFYKIQFKKNQKGERYMQIEDGLIEYAQEHYYYRLRSKSESFLEHLPKQFQTTFYTNFFKCFFFIQKASYYSATQFSDPSNCPVSIELEGNRRSPHYRLNRQHDKFIYDLYQTYKQDPKSFSRFLNTINKNGIGLISDIEFYEYDLPNTTFEVKTGGKIKQIDKEKQIIVPSFKIDKTTLTPNQLSEGTFKTIALIYYILNDNSNLLLIEEPEVCVHHGLLNSILELIQIKASEKQIIISTHSDFVLDKLLPENVVLVLKDEVGTKALGLNQYLSKDDYNGLRNYLNEVGNLGEFWKEGGFDL